ncbi:hypothetical protein Pelo_14717 [Pelomyxa schiedti]|nr:hypothetical protein Pelo_14717 [Pelomyxa schiedti]
MLHRRRFVHSGGKLCMDFAQLACQSGCCYSSVDFKMLFGLTPEQTQCVWEKYFVNTGYFEVIHFEDRFEQQRPGGLFADILWAVDGTCCAISRPKNYSLQNLRERELVMPYKGLLGHLNEDFTTFNQVHSAVRIVVEHTNAWLKHWMCLSEDWRHSYFKLNEAFFIVASLTNISIQDSPIHSTLSPYLF